MEELNIIIYSGTEQKIYLLKKKLLFRIDLNLTHLLIIIVSGSAGRTHM